MSITKHNWTKEEIIAIYNKPMMDLLYEAATIHREQHDPNVVQVSTLLSIKTGGCPEDCAYCPQSAKYCTDLEAERLMKVKQVLREAEAAKAKGATRFCMGAAWRSPRAKDMPYVIEMIQGVKAMGMEACMTLGMLDDQQASDLADNFLLFI